MKHPIISDSKTFPRGGKELRRGGARRRRRSEKLILIYSHVGLSPAPSFQMHEARKVYSGTLLPCYQRGVTTLAAVMGRGMTGRGMTGRGVAGLIIDWFLSPDI